MSRCMYNGARLIPCPFISLSKNFIRTGDGTPIGVLWEGTITGKIVTHMGSPDHNGDFWTAGGYPANETVSDTAKLGAIFRKQEAIRKLFAEDGHLLEFQSADGTAPMKCNPRITGITFTDGQWYNTCDYTITFETDMIYVNGSSLGEDSFPDYIKDSKESWQFDTNEDITQDESTRTYRVTHEVSAEGKRIFKPDGTIEKTAYTRAREYVEKKLGFDDTILSNSNLNDMPSGLNRYNYVRSESIDESVGSYSVTETWILATEAATESFNISEQYSIDTGLYTVSIDGQIDGLETRDDEMDIVKSKYENALAKYNSIVNNIYTRAVSYTGRALHTTPVSTNVTISPNQGSISYSREYNTRQSNIVTGSLSESFTVQDSLGNDVIAIIPIPGRAKGPILQNIFTKTEKSRTVTAEIVMPIPSGTLIQRYNSSPYTIVDSIVDGLKPVASQIYTVENSPSWDIGTGRFSLTRQWTYEV